MKSIVGKSRKARRKVMYRVLQEEYNFRNYSDEDVFVKRIKGLGVGVFAARQFKPGEIVLEIHGNLYRESKYDGSSYVMEFEDDWLMEPDIPGCFVNHSCDSNCELVVIPEATAICLVTRCNVMPGMHLTFDYAWPAGEDIPICLCGSPRCRGWIVDDNQLGKQKRIDRRLQKKRKKSSKPR